MVNNELNKKIVESVRNRVVISNLESEENMKINKKREKRKNKRVHNICTLIPYIYLVLL